MASGTDLTIEQAARIMREAVRDKSYLLLPLGQEVGDYLRVKRKRLTDSSHQDYELGLDKFARYFPDLDLKDFEPPEGIQRLEEFLDHQWGDCEPRTYNKNLSILKDFFKFQILRGKIHGDPTLPIERAKTRQVHRETFSHDQSRAIIASAVELRDRLCLRLLLDYGIRKGSLQKIQFKHFDHQRRRLTLFAKGGKVRLLPIPQPHFWMDLERLILESEAQPEHYLLPRRSGNDLRLVLSPSQPMGGHGLHRWWYRHLENAGIVSAGTSRGERMHKARHSAGQNLLDKTGNLKAVQKLLGHSSIATTGDIYADWDIQALAQTLKEALDDT